MPLLQTALHDARSATPDHNRLKQIEQELIGPAVFSSRVCTSLLCFGYSECVDYKTKIRRKRMGSKILIDSLRKEMRKQASELNFEAAIAIRNKMTEIEKS